MIEWISVLDMNMEYSPRQKSVSVWPIPWEKLSLMERKKRGLTRFTIASELSYTRVIWGEIACNICHCRDGIILRARKRVREKKKREYRLRHMWVTRDVFYHVRVSFVMILWYAYFSWDLERLDFAHRKLSQFFSFFFHFVYTYMNNRIVWCMSVET